MKIGGKEFKVDKHTYIMGILNVTPDSFSDGGKFNDIDAALFHAEKMVEEGVDIIDIGGESTRPGYTFVEIDEEIHRTAPVIEKIKTRFDIPISLDTYKSEVALAGMQAGADLINDIWGLMYDDKMGKVIADTNAVCCLMHNRKEHNYVNFGEDLINDLAHILNVAQKAGIPDDKIILDPGVGFQKTTEENLWVLNNMDRLTLLGCPWLLGASRKSVIGNTLNLPVTERLEGTLATTALAAMKGASFVRVHDVLANKRVVEMLEAIKNV